MQIVRKTKLVAATALQPGDWFISLTRNNKLGVGLMCPPTPQGEPNYYLELFYEGLDKPSHPRIVDTFSLAQDQRTLEEPYFKIRHTIDDMSHYNDTRDIPRGRPVLYNNDIYISAESPHGKRLVNVETGDYLLHGEGNFIAFKYFILRIGGSEAMEAFIPSAD